MARPLRIQYPGAFYHVMNRGGASQKIFRSVNNYHTFLELLAEAISLWEIKIHAFSLMPNHYHLLMETPLGNLSRAMRHINGVYTQRFNRYWEEDGHLFRGRYRAILIEDESYLVELARYIHLNPLKANIVDKPEAHSWSSHRYYLGEKGLDWLTTDYLLSYFGKRVNLSRRKFHEFVLGGVPEKLKEKLEGKKWPSVLSREGFQGWVEWNFIKEMDDRELQYEKMERPIPERKLRRLVCRVLGTSWKALQEAIGREGKRKRRMALRCYRQVLKYDYEHLSRLFGGIHPTNISRAMQQKEDALSPRWEQLQWEIQNAKRKT